MSEQKENSSDEIDLRDLFNIISKGISNFFERIINMVALIRKVTIRNLKLFITITVVSLLVVLGYNYQLRKEVYGSSMLVKSGYLNNQLVENTIFKLNSLAEEVDKSTLSQVLQIDDQIASQIKGFDYEAFITEDEKLEVELLKEKLINLKVEDDIVKSISDKISIRNPNTFKITIFTETNSVIYTLDSAIANYFLQNNYINKRIQANRNTLTKRKAKLKKEQIKIDSLKQIISEVYQSLSNKDAGKGSDNIILGGQEVADPLTVFETDLKINDQILAIEQELFLKNEFEVIEGLTPFSKPVSISSVKLIVYTILFSIGLTYVLLILIGLNRFFITREEQQTID